MPSWSARDKVAAYAVFGHMPYYLAQIREEASLADNILALVLRPDGLLHEEARLLLDQELHDASAYFSVLRAIAAGQTRVSQIAQRTAIPGGTSRVSQMLELLCQQWLRRTLDAAAVGWWWGKVRELRGTALRDVDRELDTVAIDDEGRVVAIASCKWTAQPLSASEKERLDALAAHLVPDGPPPRLYFFAREGFDAALVR